MSITISRFLLSDSLDSSLHFSFFFFVSYQKAFHADVAHVMRKWLKEEELLPEDQKPTSHARAHYVKVSFHPLPHLPRVIFRDHRFFRLSSENLLFFHPRCLRFPGADVLEKESVACDINVNFERT